MDIAYDLTELLRFKPHAMDTNEGDGVRIYPNLPTPPSTSEGSMSPVSYTMLGTSETSNPLQQYHFLQNFQIEQDRVVKLAILEQPVEKFRFRYKSEMCGTHGSLVGRKSDRGRKVTFPTVKLENFTETVPVFVRCTLVQRNRDKPHPHRLVMKAGCEEDDDPHMKELSSISDHMAVFSGMGIVHTAKKHVVDELIRKSKKLLELENGREPTTMEMSEITSAANDESRTVDLNIVRLRFDAFTKTDDGKYVQICQPIYSENISNLKSALTGDLKITRMSRSTSSAQGGEEIYLLVEKVSKKNISVKFFELDDEEYECWTDVGRFNEIDVHHQFAIVLRTPPYKDKDIQEDRHVFVQLERKSDGAKSECRKFTYVPDRRKSRKRMRTDISSSASLSSADLPLFVNGDTDNLPEINPADKHEFHLESAEFQKYLQNFSIDDELQFDGSSHYRSSHRNVSKLNRTYNRPVRKKQNNIASAAQLGAPSYKQNKQLNRCAESQNDIKAWFRDLWNIVQSKQPASRVVMMLDTVLKEKRDREDNNLLHLCFMNKSTANSEMIRVVLCMIHQHQKSSLLDLRNSDGNTVAHLAAENNVNELELLVKMKADMTAKNGAGETPLHIAVQKNSYEAILKAHNVQDFINIASDDGITALQIAVARNRFSAVQSLCKAGANVNVTDGRDGNGMLHVAVCERVPNILRYLLECTTIDVMHTNFKGLTCYQLSSMLPRDLPENLLIISIIESKLESLGLTIQKEIKAEIESDSESEGEDERDFTSLGEDDIREEYKKLMKLPESCKDSLCDMLDFDEQWKQIVTTVEMDHILETDLFSKSVKSPSNVMFSVLSSMGVSLYQIRMAMKDLHMDSIVQAMDDVVLAQK